MCVVHGHSSSSDGECAVIAVAKALQDCVNVNDVRNMTSYTPQLYFKFRTNYEHTSDAKWTPRPHEKLTVTSPVTPHQPSTGWQLCFES